MAKDETQKAGSDAGKKPANLVALDSQIETADAAIAARHHQTMQERRKKAADHNYQTRTVPDQAIAAFRDGRKPSFAHYTGVLRLGMSITSAVMLIQFIVIIVLTVNYIILSGSISDRPIYYTDAEGVTYRLLRAKGKEEAKYIRDQIDEFVNVTLVSLYTYTPEGQPQIDLMTNLVDPEIIRLIRESYEQRLQTIISRRELRTVSINYVEIEKYDRERGFAVVQATGNLVYNNVNEAVAIPVTWSLVIELRPEIKSGSNVYGYVLKRCTTQDKITP